MNKTKIFFNGISIIFIFIIFISNTQLFAADDIRQAMRDEIERSLDGLHLESLEKPYYVEYNLTFSNYYQIKSTLGAITESEYSERALLTVGLRVGNYKLDNSNYLDFGFSFFGSGDDEEKYKNRFIPMDVDYFALRRELWLATDAAYKQISELYSKKLATMNNRVRKDTTHDFLEVAAVQVYDTVKIPEFDLKKHEIICKEISKVFSEFPEINQSSVSLEYLPEKKYFVNSEGREYIKTDFYLGLEVVAATQVEDGMPLSNHYSVFCKSPANLPTIDSLIKATREIAETLVKLTKTSTLDEPYSGPILFEGQAAAEIFAQIFAPNLVTQRMPLTERGVQESDRFTAFQTKIGGRVLPEFLSINALPTLEKIGNQDLLGSETFDDDGIKAIDVLLVKNGFLKSLLSSRVPTRRVRKSNGHKRGGAAMLSVIELKSDEKHAKSSKELTERMLKLCKDRELEFGLIVRKMYDQNIQYTSLMRISPGGMQFSGRNTKKALIEVYKVYYDGREELVRGVETKGLTVQSFKDILDVGNSNYVLNYLAPSVTSPYISGGSQYVGATIIVPDLLFEDAEIKPLEADFPKPPIIANPVASTK